MDVKVKQEIFIPEPNMQDASFTIVGTAPLMIAKFSEKAKNKMEETQRAGSTARSKKTRSRRDFEADMQAARHISTDGWDGLAAAAFRNAMIDACRAVGFQMTKGKLAVFILPDGFDRDEGTPLVRIVGEEPECSIMPVRNATGVVDLRARPMWRAWSMTVQVRYDADIFTLTDVSNLMMRVGVQVGVGEGRPYGKNGNGMGMGLFQIGALA